MSCTLPRVVAVACFSMFAAFPAQAQLLDDRVWLEGGLYWPDIRTTVQVSSTRASAVGTEINLESDLALAESDTLVSLSAGARLGRNFIIRADYYTLNREATRTLARDIVFDDVTYLASASVASGFNSDIYRLTVDYVFFRNDSAEAGGGIGLHVTDFGVFIQGEARLDDASVRTSTRSRDVLAPLPTVGLFANVAVLPRLTLSGRVDYLSLSVNDYDGRLINAQASLAYRLFRNVGVGVMYRHVNYRVDVEKERWVGTIRYRFTGPSAFVQLGF